MNGPTRVVFDTCAAVFLNGIVEKTAIELRRKSKPTIKLPDCIVAATAIVLGATCLTSDRHLLNLHWPGYTAQAL
jgi:predicted nucleic acid-binding protein